jgi:hypothetical protein
MDADRLRRGAFGLLLGAGLVLWVDRSSNTPKFFI